MLVNENKVKTFIRAPISNFGRCVGGIMVHDFWAACDICWVLTRCCLRRTGNIAGAAAQTFCLVDRELNKSKDARRQPVSSRVSLQSTANRRSDRWR